MPTGERVETEYILGTDPHELARLRLQHHAWTQRTFAFWERAGIAAGHRVLDLGCGPGYTSIDLARIVGPTGRVIASDQSSRFLAWLDAERDALGLTQIETLTSPAETIALEPDSLDFAYGRWILCWLADPGATIARIARALRPGGAYLAHEYLDWGAMKLVPKNELFERVVAASTAAWPKLGATIDLAERLPELAAAHGLVLESFVPSARLGRIGSLEWQWVPGFLRTWVPKLSRDGLLDPDLSAAWLIEHERLERDRTSWLLPPIMSEAILRRT